MAGRVSIGNVVFDRRMLVPGAKAGLRTAAAERPRLDRGSILLMLSDSLESLRSSLTRLTPEQRGQCAGLVDIHIGNVQVYLGGLSRTADEAAAAPPS